MRTELIISETEPRGDLTESITQALTKDGEHVVHRDDSGRKLIAHVSHGVIVEWRAFDKDGSEVATIVIRQPSQNPKTATTTHIANLRRARWAIVCACYESGDFCWWQPY